jgi:hypothetical protein
MGLAQLLVHVDGDLLLGYALAGEPVLGDMTRQPLPGLTGPGPAAALAALTLALATAPALWSVRWFGRRAAPRRADSRSLREFAAGVRPLLAAAVLLFVLALPLCHALAQAVLLRSVRIEAEVRREKPARYRQLFRHLKFHRLLYQVRGNMNDGYLFHIDGPLSLFSATNKYGLQMALFLPALLLCEDYRLDAELRWGPKREPKTFRLEAADGLVSHYADTGRYTPAELDAFVARFRQVAPAWEISEATDLVAVRTALQDVGGCAVPQTVRAEVRGLWHGPEPGVHHGAHSSLADTSAPDADEQRVSRRGSGELRAPGGHPRPQGPLGRYAVRHAAFPVSFPQNPQDPAAGVDVAEVESHEFADADPGGVQRLKDGVISQGHRVTTARFLGKAVQQ